jgi:hypothetical protein
MSKHFKFWRRWLIVVIVAWLAFSLALLMAPGLTRQFFGMLIYQAPAAIEAFGPAAVAYISLLHAVLGAVMFGWGTALLAVVVGPFKQLSWQAWLTLAGSLLAWFIPDSLYSLHSGFWQNAAFNLVFAVLFAIPLLACYSECLENRHAMGAK